MRTNRQILMALPFAAAIFPFIATPILVSKYGYEIVGDFYLKMGLVSFLGTLSLLGIDSEIGWQSAKRNWSAAKSLVLNSVIGQSSLIILIYLASYFIFEDVDTWFGYGPVILASIGFSSVHSQIAKHKQGDRPWIAVLELWALQLFIPLTSFLISNSYSIALWLWGISSSSIFLIVAWFSNRTKISIMIHFNAASKTFYLTFQSILFTMVPTIARIFSGNISNDELIGFQFAWLLISIPLGIAISINSFWAVLVLQGEDSAGNRKLRSTFPIYLLAIALATAATYLNKTYILGILKAPFHLGNTIEESVASFAFLPIFFVFYLAGANYLLSKKKYFPISLLSALSVALSFAFSLVIPKLSGADFVTITYAFLAFAYSFYSQFRWHWPINKFWLWILGSVFVLELANVVSKIW